MENIFIQTDDGKSGMSYIDYQTNSEELVDYVVYRTLEEVVNELTEIKDFKLREMFINTYPYEDTDVSYLGIAINKLYIEPVEKHNIILNLYYAGAEPNGIGHRVITGVDEQGQQYVFRDRYPSIPNTTPFSLLSIYRIELPFDIYNIIIRDLLVEGADINFYGNELSPPLSAFISSSKRIPYFGGQLRSKFNIYIKVIFKLLQAGADPNVPFDTNPLYTLLKEYQRFEPEQIYRMVLLLIAFGANLFQIRVDDINQSPLLNIDELGPPFDRLIPNPFLYIIRKGTVEDINILNPEFFVLVRVKRLLKFPPSTVINQEFCRRVLNLLNHLKVIKDMEKEGHPKAEFEMEKLEDKLRFINEEKVKEVECQNKYLLTSDEPGIYPPSEIMIIKLNNKDYCFHLSEIPQFLQSKNNPWTGQSFLPDEILDEKLPAVEREFMVKFKEEKYDKYMENGGYIPAQNRIEVLDFLLDYSFEFNGDRYLLNKIVEGLRIRKIDPYFTGDILSNRPPTTLRLIYEIILYIYGGNIPSRYKPQLPSPTQFINFESYKGYVFRCVLLILFHMIWMVNNSTNITIIDQYIHGMIFIEDIIITIQTWIQENIKREEKEEGKESNKSTLKMKVLSRFNEYIQMILQISDGEPTEEELQLFPEPIRDRIRQILGLFDEQFVFIKNYFRALQIDQQLFSYDTIYGIPYFTIKRVISPSPPIISLQSSSPIPFSESFSY